MSIIKEYTCQVTGLAVSSIYAEATMELELVSEDSNGNLGLITHPCLNVFHVNSKVKSKGTYSNAYLAQYISYRLFTAQGIRLVKPFKGVDLSEDSALNKKLLSLAVSVDDKLSASKTRRIAQLVAVDLDSIENWATNTDIDLKGTTAVTDPLKRLGDDKRKHVLYKVNDVLIQLLKGTKVGNDKKLLNKVTYAIRAVRVEDLQLSTVGDVNKLVELMGKALKSDRVSEYDKNILQYALRYTEEFMSKDVFINLDDIDLIFKG